MKTPFKLRNDKQRKRYLIKCGNDEWASALHCAEALGFDVSKIYRAVNSFIALGTKYNERGLLRRHFTIDNHKLFITIHNKEYDRCDNTGAL